MVLAPGRLSVVGAWYRSRLPTAAMAESQGQDSSLFSSQAVIRLSPCVLNDVQAVVMECGPGANSSTYNKEKVVAEASKDRTSLSKSPLPEEMPPPTAEGTPAGPNGGTPLPKRKRGAITPSSQPKGKTPKVARSRSDSVLATPSTSQKASHSGRRGGSQTRDLESMSTNCSGSDHSVSARVVLVAAPQDSNPAPPVNGRSVGSFSRAEPGGGRGTVTRVRSTTTRSVFVPAVRAPAPAPTQSRLTTRSVPSFRGRGSSLGRRSPGRPPSWSSPSSCRMSRARSCSPSWGPGRGRSSCRPCAARCRA